MNTKTQLMTFFLFALIVNVLQLYLLVVLMGLLLMLLLYFNNRHFFQLMRRLKWFYCVMLLIFIFNTPGEHVANWPFHIKPTYEGLHMGVEQVLRIAVMLAALSVILMHNTKQQLISGLYFLMQPLSYLGLDVQRFSARLWLTLHYVELQQVEQKKRRLTAGSLADYLRDGFADDAHDDVPIVLDNPKQTWVDYIVMIMMSCIFFFKVLV